MYIFLNTVHVQYEIQMALAVFQITFTGRVLTRSFDRSVDVGLPIPSPESFLFILSGQAASAFGFLT